MKRILMTLSILALCASFAASPRQNVAASLFAAPAPIRVLLVTGGHNHDVEFYDVFRVDRFRTTVDPHPMAFSGDIRKRYDVVVMYDMVKSLEEPRRKNLREFVESGKGVVLLHHAICGNVDWPWWYEEVAGGRYLFDEVNGRKSSYLHDVEQTIKPLMDHPITRGIAPFRILDETYKDVWISPRVKSLLHSDHPTSDGVVGWISPYEKSRVVYIQLGHDRHANLNPNWQRLVRNAIEWAGERRGDAAKK
ncbi:MAG: ThuA domain-containing protein [Blastocatellia bacterium]|nr:ThuA domain-containing protein [Blastocatellia bacterium]